MKRNLVSSRLANKINLSLLIIFLLFPIQYVYPADMAGRYLVSGIGKDSCQSFVDADEVGKSYYRSWLSGYITSHNYYNENTYSIVNKQTVDELEAWLRGYCYSNLSNTYEQAVKSLIRKLQYFKKKNYYDK